MFLKKVVAPDRHLGFFGEAFIKLRNGNTWPHAMHECMLHMASQRPREIQVLPEILARVSACANNVYLVSCAIFLALILQNPPNSRNREILPCPRRSVRFSFATKNATATQCIESVGEVG